MKLLWCLFIVGICLLSIASATSLDKLDSELLEEDDKEVLLRTVRGTKERGGASGNGGSPSCRYTKSEWSECDSKNNTRTRTLTIRKGDKNCDKTKVITKKCKKACRYDKGAWGNCLNGQMVRIDTLKLKSDTTCEKSRRMTKRCKPETTVKKAPKDRSNKKSGKQ